MKVIKVNAVHDNFDRQFTADIAAQKHFVVLAANNFTRSTSGNRLLVKPHFQIAFTPQRLLSERELHSPMLCQLVLKIHAASINHNGNVSVPAQKILSHYNIA